MTPCALSPSFAADIDLLKDRHNQPGLWQNELEDILTRTRSDYALDHDSSFDELIVLIQRAARLADVFTARLENDAAFKSALEAAAAPLWTDYSAPPAEKALQDNLAEKLYNVEKTAPGEHAFITLGDGTRQIGPYLLRRCITDQIPFSLAFTEPNLSALILNYSDEDGITQLAERFLRKTAAATKRIVAVPGMSAEKALTADAEKSRLYSRLIAPYSERSRSGDLFFTLTVIPTEKDAEIDGMDYHDYVRLFFEMCDQPWHLIDRAQQELIKELDAGKALRFTNNDGTDITMDIEGFTFCNSLIAKNVPGSEVFSAPRRDSVNGTIVAKGRFTPPRQRGAIIENLTMKFKNGYLESFTADQGAEIFERVINTDEGARYIGEVGIGTNPHLKRHVCNGLLVEKIGGSFHLALGACYTMKEYQGTPVKVDNGNQSAIHWDITTMLYGKQGRIYLDGRLIMDDGQFIGGSYDILNRGWQAVPEQERPAYWRAYYTP